MFLVQGFLSGAHKQASPWFNLKYFDCKVAAETFMELYGQKCRLIALTA
jgi:hypothetical protein